MSASENLRSDILLYQHGNLSQLDQNLVDQIDKSPGIRYRQLLRLTGLSNGVLSYHLGELEESKVIKVDRGKRVTRYYPLHISAEISNIIGYIRNSVSRQIVTILMNNNGCTLGEIAEFTNKAPSTVSWHLQRLVKAKIVSKALVRKLDGLIYKSGIYLVSDKELIKKVLGNYVESPLDRATNDYTDLIDELSL